MLEILLELDHQLFEFFNFEIRSEFLDRVVPLLRERWLWLPVYAFILSFILRNFKLYPSLVFIGFLFITVGFTDILSSQVLKNQIQRERPCQNEEIEVIARVDCGQAYSMPSSHASNHFALSVFLILGFSALSKKIRLPLIIWASLVSIAQVFVGVHYPSDVIIGALFGALVAYLFYLIYKRLFVPHYPLY